MNLKELLNYSILNNKSLCIDGSFSVGKSHLIKSLNIPSNKLLSSNRELTSDPEFFMNGDLIMNSYFNLIDRLFKINDQDYQVIDRSSVNDFTYSLLVNLVVYQGYENNYLGKSSKEVSLLDLVDQYLNIRKPSRSLRLLSVSGELVMNKIYLLIDKPQYDTGTFIVNSTKRLESSNRTLNKFLGGIDPLEFLEAYNLIYESICKDLNINYYKLSELGTIHHV
jgi:hypothetical protein